MAAPAPRSSHPPRRCPPTHRIKVSILVLASFLGLFLGQQTGQQGDVARLGRIVEGAVC